MRYTIQIVSSLLLISILQLVSCQSKQNEGSKYPDRVVLEIKPINDYALLDLLMIQNTQEMTKPAYEGFYKSQEGITMALTLPRDGIYTTSATFFAPIYLCKGCKVSIDYKNQVPIITGDHQEINTFLLDTKKIKDQQEKEFSTIYKNIEEIQNLKPDSFILSFKKIINTAYTAIDKISKSIPDSIVQMAKNEIKYYFSRAIISYIGENLRKEKINYLQHPAVTAFLKDIEVNNENLVRNCSTYPEFLSRYYYVLFYAEKGKKPYDVKEFNSFLQSKNLNNKVRESMLMREMRYGSSEKSVIDFYIQNIQEEEYRSYLRYKRHIK